jgi:hypothetical protein
MPLNCKFEELDTETRTYLHEVRTRRGRGTPGVYVPGSDPKPIWAIIVGPIVGLGLFFLALRSSKDAWAVAMLQTAGLLVGGWCVIYALRRWLGTGRNSYGGWYTYFDPLHIYEVKGELVRVTSLRTVKGVEAEGPRVWFDLRDAETSVPVGSAVNAGLVEDYYAAMETLEKQVDGPWRNAPVAELGAAARMTAEEQDIPQKVEHLDLDLATVSEDPGRANRAGLGLLGLMLIPVSAIGLFLLLTMVNRPLGDNLAFDQAKADGAPGLRGYLLDERNIRNRDEARRLLAQLYDPPIAKLNGPPAPKNPDLRKGMVKLLEMLKTSETPVVAIDLKDDGGDTTGTLRVNDLRREIADGLARGIGPTLIAFAEPAAGQPAHVTIRYKLTPVQDGNATVTTDVEIRTDLEKPPVARGSWDAVPTPAPLNSIPNAVKISVCMELVGIYLPAPPPDFGGGDF